MTTFEKRPTTFEGYLGQSGVKMRLQIAIHASMVEQRQLPHLLISGQPGLGKTTLAKIVARQFYKDITETTGPAIKSQDTLITKIKNLSPGGFLFIDEIHKLSRDVQEYLLVVLEEGEIDEETVNNGVTIIRRVKAPPFTVIGATTKMSDLDHAFRERFGIKESLSPYELSELCTIIKTYIQKRGYVTDSDDAIMAIALRSRQTPRTALSLTDGIISFTLYSKSRSVTAEITENYFSNVNKIDENGLTETDLRFLRPLLGGSLSLKRWANKIGEKVCELENIYEPYYTKLDLIQMDSKGRSATPLLFKIFGIKAPSWAYRTEDDAAAPSWLREWREKTEEI